GGDGEAGGDDVELGAAALQHGEVAVDQQRVGLVAHHLGEGLEDLVGVGRLVGRDEGAVDPGAGGRLEALGLLELEVGRGQRPRFGHGGLGVAAGAHHHVDVHAALGAFGALDAQVAVAFASAPAGRDRDGEAALRVGVLAGGRLDVGAGRGRRGGGVARLGALEREGERLAGLGEAAAEGVAVDRALEGRLTGHAGDHERDAGGVDAHGLEGDADGALGGDVDGAGPGLALGERDLHAQGSAGDLDGADPGAGGVTTRRLRERGREEQGGEEGEGSGEQRPAAAAGAAGRGGGRGWVHVVLQSRTARSEARRARGRRSVGPSMLAARCATPARPSPAALTRLTRRGPILAWLDQRSGACEVTMRRWSLHLPFGLLLGLVACVAPPPLGVVEGEATAVGGGVAGAEATLVPAGAVATDGSRSVRTDASGAFVFQRVPPGEDGLTVIAAADGLGAHVPAVSVARDETTSVPVALTPLGGITAAVDVSDRAVRPDGELVIDAFLVGTPLTARVDAAGSLVLEGVPEGGFELSLR